MNSIVLIVLNYNSYDDTVACVDRLLTFDADLRMVVVDNCSPDESGDKLVKLYAGYDRVDVVCADHNGGYGAGNNIGIRYAADKYDPDTVGIINPDVRIPDVSVIRRMYDILHSDENCAIVGGRIIDENGKTGISHSAWNIPSLTELMGFQLLRSRRFTKPVSFPEEAPGIYRVDCVAGCFFLAKTRCMMDIGLFDENMFLYYEETSVGIRAKQKGYITLLADECCYYHDHRTPESSAGSLRDKLSVTDPSYRSALYLCRQYYPRTGLILLWLAERFNKLYLTGAYIRHLK